MNVTAPRTGFFPPDSQGGTGPVRLVIIGAGAAAVMLLERLRASHRREAPGLALDIRLVDPHEPGGGRIWRRTQSPLLKLNSMLEDVAFFTDPSCTIDGPIEPGPSLAEWVREVRAGRIPLPDWSDARLEAEVAGIDDREFPTRRLNSAYLGWAYREVLRRAEPTVEVGWVRGRVTSVTPAPAPAGAVTGEALHAVQLETGDRLEADAILYAVGHNGSCPSDDSFEMERFASRHGLGYVAPAFTADIDLDWIPAGDEVIVRGMGLAAVDLVVLLTEGRGGVFERDSAGRLRYLPSGREPALSLGSRRGVPYRSKVTSVPVGSPVELEYLGESFHASLTDRTTPLDFDADVWPLIQAELITGYYRELFTGHPDRVVGDWESFAGQLRGLLAEPGGADSEALTALVAAHVPHADDRFRFASLDRPLDFLPDDLLSGAAAGTGPSERSADDAVQQRVLQHIEQDLRQRTRQDHSATQVLFLTALFSYMSVSQVPVEWWNARSRAHSLPRRWHSFFSYVASGPPSHRLEELVALAEAGTVRFLGGQVQVELDDRVGQFVASGSARTAAGIADTCRAARTLIDAWLPEAQAERSDNPLLRHLINGGIATELQVSDIDFAGSTGQVVVGENGELPGSPGQFAVGPFTSIPPAGAFTRPGIDSLSFKLHDRTARAILHALERAAAERRESGTRAVASPV